MATAIQLSFYKWTGLNNSPATFVGIQNYISIFTEDPVFWTAFRNSAVWVVMSLLIPTTVSLVLALGVNEKIFGRGTFRSVFYIPAIVSSIAVATTWRWMYNENYGIINEALRAIGLGQFAQAWLANGELGMLWIVVALLWLVLGCR